jgi:hypothetical protein
MISAVSVTQNNVGTDEKPCRYYSMYARNRACSDNAAKEERLCSAINWKAGSGRTQKWVVGFMATMLKGSFAVLRRSGIYAHARKVDTPHSQWKDLRW